MVPDGIIVLRCPNAEYHVREWLEASDEDRMNLSTGLRNSILGHHKSYTEPGHIHQNLFTVGTLRRYLEKAGFVNVTAQTCAPMVTGVLEHIMTGGLDSPYRAANLPDSDLFAMAEKEGWDARRA